MEVASQAGSKNRHNHEGSGNRQCYVGRPDVKPVWRETDEEVPDSTFGEPDGQEIKYVADVSDLDCECE